MVVASKMATTTTVGQEIGQADGQSAIDAFRSAIDKAYATVDFQKPALQDVSNAVKAMNTAYDAFFAHIAKPKANVWYNIVSASSSLAYEDQPIHMNTGNTSTKLAFGGYSEDKSMEEDALAAWRLVPIEGQDNAYAIQLMANGQYFGPYRGDGADNAPLLSHAKARSIDYFARAIDYLMVKNPDAALADIDDAISLSPQFMLAYMLRADAHYMQYRMAQARDAGAASLQGDAPDMKSQAMLRQRQDVTTLDLMLDDLDQAIKLSPKNAYAHYNKGNVYMMQGDFTSAISCYTTAIEQQPDLAEAYYNRGLMYLRMGNKTLGVADLSQAGELGILPSYNVLKRMTR